MSLPFLGVVGGEERVRYARLVACEACRGTGAKDGTRRRRCDACQGTGTRVQQSRRRERGRDVLVRGITGCPACDGKGQIIEERCPACGGRGVVEREESLTVNVPVGVEDGMALRVPGRGMSSEAKGGVPGDLFVIVRSAPDPRFERRGADLWRTEVVTLPEAVLGGRRTVPTLDGSVEVTIPPATQPGSVLRLAGQGLPEFGGRARGDLYLRLRVQVPERLSEEQRALYERLRALERAETTSQGA